MTFKRHYHEDGLTEAHYDYLLPVADPVTVLATTPISKQQAGTLTITRETQTGTTYQTPTSLAKVFGVLELAEKILLQLPPENLLCKVQRVCRRWHELVRDSELIQEYLFFKPITQKASYGWVTESVFRWQEEVFEKKWKVTTETPKHRIENPWLYLFSEASFASPPRPGSWQRMFSTQPPIEYANRQQAQLLPLVMMRIGDRFVGSYDRERYVVGAQSRGMTLHVAQGWGTEWKPLAGWETIKEMKKEIRLDEKFLEIEIAEMD